MSEYKREPERDPEPLSPELRDQFLMFFHRLDEQQKRWFAALEAARRGYGGISAVSDLLGLSINTIRRGRDELATGLADRPTDRTRNPGGGRHTAQKKTLP